MNLRMRPSLMLLLCASLLLQACEERSSGDATFQPLEPLPGEFVDTLGEMWRCENSAYDTEVTGTVSLQSPAEPLQNSDLLHVALFKQVDNRLTSLNSYCVNNIGKRPVAFAVGYDEAAFDNQARYVVRANYFRAIGDGDLYEASHKPDGSTEVISNNGFQDITIMLKPIGQ